ncbi:MAG TPA: Wadjet anti-phage system protein JetD domain-containing protein [Anaerolineales bacterium]|nr:Wadjet anti-phage system protein JetD domain-containing protein [Anaerolineales bacterium]
MEITFSPSPDVAAVLNALLDRLENRARRANASAASSPLTPRAVKVRLADLNLPAYFSQTDPEPRLTANQQFQELAWQHLLSLSWLPGETGHLLEAITLQAEEAIYVILQREPLINRRMRLETLLLADHFRFPAGDWRAQAVRYILEQVRLGKSPSPFSLTDAGWNLDLMTVLAALSGLEVETPYRVFSVRIFNDSKRFEELKPALVRLARLANPFWKRLPVDVLLRELNLVANPGYIHFAGNWQFIIEGGEILTLSGFVPSVGFPAAQTASIQAVAVQAEAVLCIENLTTFHEFARRQHPYSLTFAVVCILGNPFPSLRRMLRLIPNQTPIYLWADLDYGGFNILSQLRQQVRPCVMPYLMDKVNFDTYAHLSRPLTQSDVRNLKQLASRPELQDVHPVLDHLLRRGLKLEQEAIS